jgi:glycosyltransferase involved in cell wall biosynthesis
MGDGKKKILMIPSWYPTNGDPIGGSFFREQALALSGNFDFLVAFIEFETLSVFRVLSRVLRGKGLVPHPAENDFEQPPRVFMFVGYGISLGKLKRLLPFRFLDQALERVNEARERQLYLCAYDYAARSLDFVPDLLYAMTAQVNAIQVTDLGRAVGLPVIIAEHVPFSIDAIPENKRMRLKKAIENADALLTVSHDKSRQILMGNIDCSPIVVGNMVDQNMFTLKPNAPRDRFTILIVAAHNFYKDYITFFKSMAHLQKRTEVPFRLVVIGIDMIKSKGAWSKGLDAFVQEFEPFGLGDITTIVGFVNRAEMVDYYHKADAFVLTSIQEGLPVCVLEAMACGLPIFSTRCGGVEDIVDNSCGRVLPVRDHIAIAEALREYMEGRIRFDKAHIRDTVVARYGIDAFKERMSGIFDQCIGGHGLTPRETSR